MMKYMNLMIFMLINISSLMIMINSMPSNYKNFHPLIMGLILITMMTFMSLNLTILLKKSWWSMITFIIIIGGMMILFMYFTSFISNMITSMKFMFYKNLNYKMILSSCFLIIMISKMQNYMMWLQNFTEFYNKEININMLYFYNLNFIYIFCVMYILISLNFTVKMIIKNKFTLRKMN
uniref:NADH dehydrogenase subunit 6 n=1 Tax=Diaphorencyrtus aligarhensis TaxID=436678 RepID=A0A6C0M4P2_9HYME|nr:NADH dehydrogenase subunit 6 [Diaphorencyrtus aligarhensis]QHU77270.1 NADH dehydrogenase subunit 6 [Diaphorencyrtus aligarhensis]